MSINNQKMNKNNIGTDDHLLKTEISIEVVSVVGDTVGLDVYVGTELIGTQYLTKDDVLHIAPLYKKPVAH